MVPYRWADKKKGQSRADNEEGEPNSCGEKNHEISLSGNLTVLHITAYTYEVYISFTKQAFGSHQYQSRDFLKEAVEAFFSLVIYVKFR